MDGTLVKLRGNGGGRGAIWGSDKGGAVTPKYCLLKSEKNTSRDIFPLKVTKKPRNGTEPRNDVLGEDHFLNLRATYGGLNT